MTAITATAMRVNETITTCSFDKGYALLATGSIDVTLVIRALANTRVASARWDVTTAGKAPESTVTIPRITCPQSRTRVSVANFVIRFDQW